MSKCFEETEYIVSKTDVLKTIKCALECDFSKTAIVDLLMLNIKNDIETMLEDDCEILTVEMREELQKAKDEREVYEWIPYQKYDAIIGYYEWKKCGNCGGDMLSHESEFCPNCGAKMTISIK